MRRESDPFAAHLQGLGIGICLGTVAVSAADGAGFSLASAVALLLVTASYGVERLVVDHDIRGPDE